MTRKAIATGGFVQDGHRGGWTKEFPFSWGAWEDWTRLARCNLSNHDLFFPEHTSSERARITHGAISFTERRAKAICVTCPVRGECLNLMYQTGEQEGIWGGTTERERAKYRHTDDCGGCNGRVPVLVDYDQAGRVVKTWYLHGCKPVQDRVADLLDAMDAQAERNGLRPREETA